MTFIAAGFMELVPGHVQKAVKIVRDAMPGFYNVTLATGVQFRHIAGKFLMFGTFSDDRVAPEHIEHAKTYPASDSGAYDRTQRPYEQLTLW
jgi:hypothetical protein